jgi:hypothetical protein
MLRSHDHLIQHQTACNNNPAERTHGSTTHMQFTNSTEQTPAWKVAVVLRLPPLTNISPYYRSYESTTYDHTIFAFRGENTLHQEDVP